MSRVLITGGAGYIGAVLTPALLKRGHRVTVLDSFQHGENSLAACCADPQFHAVRGDCRDEAILAPLLADAEIVIPLAALVGAPACDRDRSAAETTNLTAIHLLCDLVQPNHRIIFPTTNSGYGASQEICTEETPLNPLSVYGVTKMHAEHRVMQHPRAISLRLATVFGASPRMRTDLLVNDFVLRAVRDQAVALFEAAFRRNFIHVRDVAGAFAHAIDHFDTMAGQVYNCGDTRANMSKDQLCFAILKHVPSFQWFLRGGLDPDKRDYEVSNAKLEATGWRPEYSLDDGIKELIRLYATLRTGRYVNA